MYFNALYFGLFEAPPRNNEIRKSLEDRIKSEGLFSLYSELEKIDPQSASRISPGDKSRIIRALEVYLLTGRPISELQKQNKRKELKWLLLYLNIERKELYNRINKRVEEMIERGLIEEVKQLIEKFGEEAYALGSIGYRHIKEYLSGKLALNEAIEQIKRDTRHYAKRQITWFKKIPQIIKVNPEDKIYIENVIKNFLKDDE